MKSKYSSQQPSIVITGGSSGIGKDLALTYAKHHYQVYTLSRQNYQWEQPNIQHIPCDVTKPDDLNSAYLQIKQHQSKIDILICCAGYGISGVTEETHIKNAKNQFEVNFFGVFSTIQSFLPLLKKGKTRKIIYISSVAGEIAIPFQSFYSASKSAVNTLLEAWQLELKPFGIQICSFLLGDIKTPFTQHREKCSSPNPIYQKTLEHSLTKMEKDEQNGLSSIYVSQKIYEYSQKSKLAPRQTIGLQYKLFLFLEKLLPKKFILFLVGKLYA